MIRDPSDGSVRDMGENVLGANGPCESVTLKISDLPHASGLPFESQKPEAQAKLEKSREWLKDYFKRNPEQGT